MYTYLVSIGSWMDMGENFFTLKEKINFISFTFFLSSYTYLLLMLHASLPNFSDKLAFSTFQNEKQFYNKKIHYQRQTFRTIQSISIDISISHLNMPYHITKWTVKHQINSNLNMKIIIRHTPLKTSFQINLEQTHLPSNILRSRI